MATATQPNSPVAVAVIRQTPLVEGVEGVRWQRQMPAWVISGGLHVVLIALFVLTGFASGREKSVPSDQVIETKVEETESKENLINPTDGLDPDTEYAPVTENLTTVSVKSEEAPNDPVGRQDADPAPPQDVQPPAGAGGGDGSPISGPDGASKAGAGGGSGGINAPGFRGRASGKKNLLASEGGNSETEAAVARGLIWLAKQQKGDGHWAVDGTHKDDIAGTGLGLLPFLAAGETHKKGHKYTRNVLNGLTYLMGRQKPDGGFTGSTGMYAQAIATIALCEAYGMTQDPMVQTHAQRALDFIVRAQHAAGGWRYRPGQAGDTSVTGWQVQALMSGKLARMSVPPDTLTKAAKYLDDVQSEYGARYGYTDKGGRPSMTAVGLLCRQYLGWGPKNQNLARGVDFLKTHPPDGKRWDIYYYYYATQVVHFFGGEDWHVFWNPPMRKLLVTKQEKAQGANFGSWAADNTHTGTAGGRLVATCLTLLTLEVYYRHLPLYRRDNAGLKELET